MITVGAVRVAYKRQDGVLIEPNRFIPQIRQPQRGLGQLCVSSCSSWNKQLLERSFFFWIGFRLNSQDYRPSLAVPLATAPLSQRRTHSDETNSPTASQTPTASLFPCSFHFPCPQLGTAGRDLTTWSRHIDCHPRSPWRYFCQLEAVRPIRVAMASTTHPAVSAFTSGARPAWASSLGARMASIPWPL